MNVPPIGLPNLSYESVDEDFDKDENDDDGYADKSSLLLSPFILDDNSDILFC